MPKFIVDVSGRAINLDHVACFALKDTREGIFVYAFLSEAVPDSFDRHTKFTETAVRQVEPEMEGQLQTVDAQITYMRRFLSEQGLTPA